MKVDEFIDDIAVEEDSCEEDESHYKAANYRGGAPVEWCDEYWEEEEDGRWSPEVCPGNLIATCSAKGKKWDWYLITNEGGGYHLEYGQNFAYPDSRYRPVLGSEFDDISELSGPIVCVVETSRTLDSGDLLWIMQNGQDAFKPIDNLESTSDTKYACRYIERITVDTRWFEK